MAALARDPGVGPVEADDQGGDEEHSGERLQPSGRPLLLLTPFLGLLHVKQTE